MLSRQATHASTTQPTSTTGAEPCPRSHGLFRVPFYVNALGNPGTDAKAVPVLSHPAPALVRVDAATGFCPLALKVGLPALTEKAHEQGIAALAINNAYNIAALWPEVEHLAENGLVAMAFTAANAFVRDGKPIPEGWAIDANGQPTTDPEAALAGAQLPFGGHKGASIALMVELLAGALIGDLFSFESTERDVQKTGAPFGGEFLLAIDPAKFGNGNLESRQAHAEQLFAAILEQPGTRLPGDRRRKARLSTRTEGITIPTALHTQLAAYRSN